MFTSLQAQSTVTDLERAEDWYTLLFGRAPDAAPMPGLLEWHLCDTFGVQVWREPERAGSCTMVFGEPDIDAAAARMRAAGIAQEGPVPGGGGRTLMLTDPDGNRVVLTGT